MRSTGEARLPKVSPTCQHSAPAPHSAAPHPPAPDRMRRWPRSLALSLPRPPAVSRTLNSVPWALSSAFTSDDIPLASLDCPSDPDIRRAQALPPLTHRPPYSPPPSLRPSHSHLHNHPPARPPTHPLTHALTHSLTQPHTPALGIGARPTLSDSLEAVLTLVYRKPRVVTALGTSFTGTACARRLSFSASGQPWNVVQPCPSAHIPPLSATGQSRKERQRGRREESKREGDRERLAGREGCLLNIWVRSPYFYWDLVWSGLGAQTWQQGLSAIGTGAT